MKKQVLIFFATVSAIFLTVQFTLAECGTTNAENHALTQTDEFGPLEIAISDLESIQELLDSGDKKTAITITKSAKGQLRKISQLSKRMVKGMGARLDKAIAAIKKDDFTSALAQIEHVLEELQSFN